MTRARAHTYTTFVLALLTGCGGGLFADENNDTQFGDDDGGGETGDPFAPPPPVDDHGVGDYCVARARADVADWGESWFSLDDVEANERWHHALARSYGGRFDTSGKPNPSVTPVAMPAGDWPLAQHYLTDAAERSGTATGLVSTYHLQLPVPGASTVIDPGVVQSPYHVDLFTNSFVPGEAFRHSGAGPGCCAIDPNDDEMFTWGWSENQVDWVLDNGAFPAPASVDCYTYVVAAGVQADAGGYPGDQGTSEAGADYIARSALCVHGGGRYSPDSGAAMAVQLLGQNVNPNTIIDDAYPRGVVQVWQAPVLINYGWMSTLVRLVDWQQVIVGAMQTGAATWLLSKFNVSAQAAAAAVLWVANRFYLPPSDFAHPRYGIGGFCAFFAHIYYDYGEPDLGYPGDRTWWAHQTCPVGYYAALPSFDHSDSDNRLNGVSGPCRLDGVDGAPLVGGGQVLAPSGFGADTYYVTDIRDFAGLLSRVGTQVTPELTDALAQADNARADFYAEHGIDIAENTPRVRVGDTIAWYSTPDGIDASYSDAMTRSLGYDDEALAELAHALGWADNISQIDSFVRVWIDEQPIGTLAEVLGDRANALPSHLAKRTTVSLRRHHAWHLRIEASDGWVTFLHFVG